MKKIEKQLAQDLRKKGWSMNEIQRDLKVSKSSVSLWVRDIKLTKKQKQKLSKKGIKKEVIEKRRNTRMVRENKRRQLVVDVAKKDIEEISEKDLFIIGTVLYWAEGGKTIRGIVRVANGDPLLIKVMMKYFRDICKVPEAKFRGHIHIHHHLDARKAEIYWSKISRIPLRQFHKTYNKLNKSSKNKKDTLPYGTFEIYVCNTELFLKIKGWTKGICEKVLEV